MRLDVNLPSKPKLLRIGEAARLLGLEPYVLRYWETEFTQLAPPRTSKGQRLYSEADLEMLKIIQKLLHEEGLTIEGARRRLQESAHFRQLTLGITQELMNIRELLTTPSRPAAEQDLQTLKKEQ